ncbi:hypothetical protein BDA99DRAFT_536262 [Phascolomyces articulosus]|uniref:Uncharacterized protein n=1 Tax=Phascolomyces articulosus TaxID=60185 RepID=A0AAD5PFK6_9FUNG|nr:hypothetical protein BDA99DRAFT_536262 [Phascolomyces articulosus]
MDHAHYAYFPLMRILATYYLLKILNVYTGIILIYGRELELLLSRSATSSEGVMQYFIFLDSSISKINVLLEVCGNTNKQLKKIINVTEDEDETRKHISIVDES